MKHISTLALSLFLFLQIFSGCKNEMIGPDIEKLGGFPEFKNSVFGKSRDTLKTALNEVIYFTASFQNDVIWKIKLTGEKSGATFNINGVGKTIDQSNSAFLGIADNSPAKFTNEKVTAVLSFPNYSQIQETTTFYIFTDKAFQNTASVIVTNFENVGILGFGAKPPVDGKKYWFSEYPLPSISSLNPSPAGGKNLLFSGKPPKSTDPKVAYTEMYARLRDGGLDTDITFPLYVDPDRVYFNVYAYSASASGNFARLIFTFKETDGTERTFEINQPNWTGWKLFSIKYSDLTSSAGLGRPDQLTTMGFVFLSANTDLTKTVSIAIDQLIFTFDKPYQP